MELLGDMRPLLVSCFSHGVSNQGQNWAAGSDSQLSSLAVHQILISGMSSDCRNYCFFLDKKDRWMNGDWFVWIFFHFSSFLRTARMFIVVKALYKTLKKSHWWKLEFINIFLYIFVFEVHINFKHILNSNFSVQVEPHLFLFCIS